MMAHTSGNIPLRFALAPVALAIAIVLIPFPLAAQDSELADSLAGLTDDLTEWPTIPASIGSRGRVDVPHELDFPSVPRRTNVTVITPIKTGSLLHEPSIAAGRVNPAVVDVGVNDQIGNMKIFFSSTGGVTFPIMNDLSLFPGMGYPLSSDPVVRADAKTTNFYFVGVGFNDACVSATPNGIIFTKSTDGGQTWAPITTVDQTPNGGVVFHDKPWMAIDRWSASPAFGRIWVDWDKYTGYPCSATGIVQIQSSADGGATWTAPVSIFQSALDQRETWPGEVVGLSDGTALAAYMGEPILGTYRVRVVKCTTASCSLASSLPAVAVPDAFYRFQNLPGTRQNSITNLAINDLPNGNGAVLLVWTDIGTGLGQIRAAVSTTGGQGFQVVGVVDPSATTDQFHPSPGWWVDTNGQSYAVVCYYQRVSETTRAINFKCARSSNNGQNWTTVLMTSSPFTVGAGSLSGFLGDYTDSAYPVGSTGPEWQVSGLQALPIVARRAGGPDGHGRAEQETNAATTFLRFVAPLWRRS